MSILSLNLHGASTASGLPEACKARRTRQLLSSALHRPLNENGAIFRQCNNTSPRGAHIHTVQRNLPTAKLSTLHFMIGSSCFHMLYTMDYLSIGDLCDRVKPCSDHCLNFKLVWLESVESVYMSSSYNSQSQCFEESVFTNNTTWSTMESPVNNTL